MRTLLTDLSVLQSDTFALAPSGSSYQLNVHKALLEQKCKTIYVACTKFKEKETGVYRFEDVSEGTLVRFIQWAYTADYQEELEFASRKEHLVETKNDQSFTPVALETDENHILLLHGRLYVFGDVYLVKDLKILAFKRMKAKLEKMNKPSDVKELTLVVDLFDFIFSNVHADDPLLDFLGKYAAYNIVNLKQQQYFNDVVGKMGPAICKYLQPCNDDPFND